MASFQWAAPTGKGARRVPRSMTLYGGGRGSQQETFDAFEASDAGAEAFTHVRVDRAAQLGRGPRGRAP